MFPSTKRAVAAAFASGLAVGIVGTGIAATSGSTIFPDVPVGSYYDKAVGVLNERGVIMGNPDGTFKPGDPVKRADVAVMLYRLLVDLGYEREEGTNVSRRSSSSEQTSSQTTSASSSSAAATSPNGTIRFATNSATIIENASLGGINVALVRTGGVSGTVDITLTSADGTAKAAEDYQQMVTTVTFAQGESSKTVKLSLIDDATSEGSETVLLNLSNPTGGSLLGTPAQMTITITDNEAPSSGASSSSSTSAAAGAGRFTLSAAGYGPAENGGTMTVTVQRTDGSTGNVAVNYSTSNGTAISGTDYGPVSSTLNFASGETSKTFTVPIYDNGAIDGNRNFTVSLSNPTGGTVLGDTPSATAMIYDDETLAYGTGSLKFSKSTYAVTEVSGVALITISRVGGAKGQVKVNYATSNGSAIASDYTPVSGTMTFENGETAKTFRVTILQDEIADADETINLSLSNPTGGAQLIDPVFAVINIQ